LFPEPPLESRILLIGRRVIVVHIILTGRKPKVDLRLSEVFVW
jgi:hypothetical protein